MKYGRTSIAVMARAVGWGSNSEPVSWVAMAESGGNAGSVNSIGCVGLLQINQPVHVKSHPTWTVQWLKDPMNNLTAGLVLFKAAGGRFDRDWADSKNKGGIPEGWGPHVAAALGGGGSGDASQASDDPCELLKGTPGYEYCTRNKGDSGPDGTTLGDTAEQLGRLAQAVAKAGNWIADPANWVRIAYVAGGGVLALVAVNVIIQPYAARAYRQVAAAIPTRTVRDVSRQVRPNPKESDQP
jgi:hypothetical protein